MGYEFKDNEDLFFPKMDPEYEYSDPYGQGHMISAGEMPAQNPDMSGQ